MLIDLKKFDLKKFDLKKFDLTKLSARVGIHKTSYANS